ncbi:hypothetical protein E2C01_065901 [Portunus trituberculatus]|uniref:Secreted protein n=1 Tax=Portunus trituberculatus TaxID=210409 RepID=A0A5B7HQX6_PORTR|nr:hypothetical protein [Portunus trituberculatus]
MKQLCTQVSAWCCLLRTPLLPAGVFSSVAQRYRSANSSRKPYLRRSWVPPSHEALQPDQSDHESQPATTRKKSIDNIWNNITIFRTVCYI